MTIVFFFNPSITTGGNVFGVGKNADVEGKATVIIGNK